MKSSSSILKSGVPQGSVWGPILVLIYIFFIGKNLIASILINVDDTKVKLKVNGEEDVEDINSLYSKTLVAHKYQVDKDLTGSRLWWAG